MPKFKECIEQNGCNVGALEEVDLDCTYTIEYFTAYADFLNWQLKGIPMLPQLDLDNFMPDNPAVPGSSGVTCCFRERVSSDDDDFVVPSRHPDSVMSTATILHVR